MYVSVNQVNYSGHYYNVATKCKTVVAGLLDALRTNSKGITEYDESLSNISIELSKRFSPSSRSNKIHLVL